MQNSDNLYDVLNVSKNSSQDEIKKAFRKLAMENHPDKNNGNKESEIQFKKINEAYNVLVDPEKRKNYDNFGIIDGLSGQPNGGPGMDINDILKNMFGGMGGFPGMSGMNNGENSQGGFSFVFSDIGGGCQIPEEMFGGGFPFGDIHGMSGHKKRKELDIVEIPIDICDIYYGNNKKVEFDILDQCDKCHGSGAYDSSHIVTCLSCNGQGNINQQIGPFFMQKSMCSSCMGKGNIIKKQCLNCKGEKTMFNKRVFELKIPKGIPNNHEMKMEKKGSYNVNTKQHKDMIFKFKYNIENPYSIDDNLNVIYNIDLTIEDLLAGFRKNIKLYKDDITLVSNKYFNPKNDIIIKEKGILNIKNKKISNLIFKFNIQFTDSERLSRYNEVLQKVLKKQNIENSHELDSKIILDIHGL
jgi:molecular chaperone DnaJ